jgi:hypothetical protein
MVKASDLDGLMRVANMLGKAGPMLPAHIKSPGEALAVIMAGAELGIPPMASLRGIHLVKGKVGMDYSLMIGLMRRAGYGVQWVTKSATRCELLLTHRDGTTHAEVWDVERAKKAGLWGGAGSWSNYPEAMLTARCTSSAARAFAGDVLAGCYSMEEVREISGGTASIGGSEVHVAEIIPEASTYANEEHAHARDAAKANADEWTASKIALLSEATAELVEDLQRDDALHPDDRVPIIAAYKGKLRAWCELNAAEVATVYAHPGTHGAKRKLWNALLAYAKACDVSDTDMRGWLSGGAS